MTDPFAPLVPGGGQTGRKKEQNWKAVFPVPANAPARPTTHPQRGMPSACWTYRDPGGQHCAYAVRFDGEDGDKVVLPLTWQVDTKGQGCWRWAAIEKDRPLYCLDQLSRHPNKTVLVCEGEKAAEAAQALLPDFVATTSSGGCKATTKSDWSMLAGRHVLIWPDADAPGQAYASEVAHLVLAAGAKSVAAIEPPETVEPGWDAADALKEGWTEEKAKCLLAQVKEIDRTTLSNSRTRNTRSGLSSTSPLCNPVNPDSSNSVTVEEGDESGNNQKRKRPPQRDQVLSVCETVQLWHDEGFDAWATFEVRGHHENWPIRSREFRRWIAAKHYSECGSTLGSQAMEDALRVLDARAVNEGEQHTVFVRSGQSEGTIWIDLCDRDWRAVKITPGEWSVVEQASCKFHRCQAMLPFPEPDKGGFIEELRNFIRVSKEEDFLLIVAWLVMSLRPYGPYPIMLVNGEHGSAKSTTSKMLRKLADPARAPLRSAPKDDQNVAVEAANAWVIAIDNLSGMPNWLSDALCKVATGSGLTTRRLHTDREQEVFDAARPIVLNGINDLAERGDLASRGIAINLPAIPDSERRSEDEIWADFDEAWPRLLGALFVGLSRAMQRKSSVQLSRLPRMADFAKWAEAAAPAFGWEEGQFLAAYETNLKGATESKFENDALAVAIRDKLFEEFPEGFTGTPTWLFNTVMQYAPDAREQRRGWPTNPATLGKQLRRIAPMLRTVGIEFESGHSGDRMCRLWRNR